MDDVMAMKAVSEVAVSPDGERVAYVVTERSVEADAVNSDVWIVSTAGGDARRLTSGPRTDRGPQWSPDGSWIAFVSDRSDDERAQVYGIDPDGGEAWQLTKLPSGVTGFRLSPDGKRLLFLGTGEASQADRDLERERGKPIVRDSAYASEFTRLWVATLDGHTPVEGRIISPEGFHVTSMTWGPDSRAVAFSAQPQPALVSAESGVVYVQSEPGAEARPLTSTPGNEVVVAWPVTPGLVIASSGEFQGTANTGLYTVPVTGEPMTALTAAIDEDASYVWADSKALLVEVNERTGRGLWRITLTNGKPSGAPVRMTGTGRFDSGFDVSGGTIAWISETGTESPEVYASPVSSIDGKRLTNTNPQAASLPMGEQRVVNWKSAADSESIEGVLTLPVGYAAGSKVPLLVVVHGGPGGVSSARYPSVSSAYPVQVFTSMGYAVLQPNFRGSTGYGARFRGLNRGDILGKDWIDVNSGVTELIRTGMVDSTKMGLMGWSYGGLQTFWGITAAPRRFAAASAGAGANDLTAFFSQTDISDYLSMLLDSTPWDKPELWRAHSAYTRIKEVTTPLLIQSGSADRRVSPEQSIQFYEAMKRIGRTPVKLILYPGQGHSINAPRLARDRMRRNVEWFDYWVPVQGSKPQIPSEGAGGQRH